MPARDSRPQLRAKVVRAKATRDKTDKAARNAQVSYRVALMKACEGGVTKADLARDLKTDPSNVARLIKQAKAEAER